MNLVETNVRVLAVESLQNHIITLQITWKLTFQELEVYLSVLPAETIVNLVSFSIRNVNLKILARKNSQGDTRKICFLRSKLQDKADGEATSCLLVMPYTSTCSRHPHIQVAVKNRILHTPAVLSFVFQSSYFSLDYKVFWFLSKVVNNMGGMPGLPKR